MDSKKINDAAESTKSINVTLADPLFPAFNERNFTLVFALDDKFINYLTVALESFMEHNYRESEPNMGKPYSYDLLILDSGISKRNKKLLLRQLAKYGERISLRFINMKPFFAKYKNVNFYSSGRFSSAMYDRFFIPEICRNYDRVLYLDCDLMVQGNLEGLWESYMEVYAIAGVREFTTHLWERNYSATMEKINEKTRKTLAINSIEDYVNSGVLLFNIEKCREIKFTDRCVEILKNGKNYALPDQCIINQVCSGHIKILGYRYNFFASFLESEEVSKSIPEEVENVAIVHFTGGKSWSRNFFDYESHVEWYGYFMKTPFFNTFARFLLKFNYCRYRLCALLILRREKKEKYRKKVAVLRRIWKRY